MLFRELQPGDRFMWVDEGEDTQEHRHVSEMIYVENRMSFPDIRFGYVYIRSHYPTLVGQWFDAIGCINEPVRVLAR